MNAFDFILPTKIRYGHGICWELEKEIKLLKKRNICIVTDPGLIQAGIIHKILQVLSSDLTSQLYIFDQVEPNPRDTTVMKAYEQAKKKNVDVIIAVGGGSSMDLAKALSILLISGGTPQDYEGLDQVKQDTVPIIAIPTTVGTGSEVTFWSVITDTERHFKMSIGTTKIAPKVALVDPSLVENLPKSIVASTGMDALTHAIEGYTCLLSEPITDALGIYAVQMISENLRNAAIHENSEAKANMLVGSLLAGICFGNSDIASVHAMAEALGGLYDTPHGIANAILLPYVMAYNCEADTKKFAAIAQAMGEDISGLSQLEAAKKSVTAVKSMTHDLNIPTLKNIGVKKEDLLQLSQKSAANVSSNSNVRAINQDGYLKLFQIAYE